MLSENEKTFLSEIKSIFHRFQRAFTFLKLSQTWECVFNSLTKYFTRKENRSRIFNISLKFYLDISANNNRLEKGCLFLYFVNNSPELWFWWYIKPIKQNMFKINQKVFKIFYSIAFRFEYNIFYHLYVRFLFFTSNLRDIFTWK